MHMNDMIETVQKRAGIDSTQAANDTLIAVAQTLAERDLAGEQQDFAAQLPEELKTVMTQTATKSQEKFDATEFLDRVGARLGTSAQQSETRVQAALSVMLEGVSDGERLDMLNALPNDFTPYAVWNV